MGYFKDLRAWHQARDLVVVSKRFIERLPADERHALGAQWRRACYSVALNIAEGARRQGPRQFRHHLDIARASLDEIEAILDLAVAQAYFNEVELQPATMARDACARSVCGLLRGLGGRPRTK